MLEFGNKEFRNLQEQVGKNQEDIKTLKSGIKIETWLTENQLPDFIKEENVGKYYIVTRDGQDYLYIILKRANGGLIADSLGKYPAVAKGEKGDTGDTGEKGEKGLGLYGVTAQLPSPTAYQEGDMFLLNNGNIYKKIIGEWVLQCNIRGPQGVVGPSGDSHVTANPVGIPTEVLASVSIDGINYEVLAPHKRVTLSHISHNSSGIVTTDTGILVNGDSRIIGQLDVDNSINASSVNVSTTDDIVFSEDDTTLTDKLTDQVITTEKLASVLEGSDTVVVDENLEGDKLQVRLDNDVTNKLDRALVTPLTTPSEKMIVGVDTNNSQAMFKITNGIKMSGSTSPFSIEQDIESGTITLTPDLWTAVDANFYIKIGKLLYIFLKGEVTRETTGTITFGNVNNIGAKSNKRSLAYFNDSYFRYACSNNDSGNLVGYWNGGKHNVIIFGLVEAI